MESNRAHSNLPKTVFRSSGISKLTRLDPVDDRAEPSQAGSVSSAGIARLGSVFLWNTEPSLIIIIFKILLLLGQQ